jgi:hypothetical protein
MRANGVLSYDIKLRAEQAPSHAARLDRELMKRSLLGWLLGQFGQASASKNRQAP